MVEGKEGLVKVDGNRAHMVEEGRVGDTMMKKKGMLV